MNINYIKAFWQLTKPDITLLVLITTLLGYILGISQSSMDFNLVYMLHLICGSALSAAGGSSLNGYIESNLDAKMNRTKNRPIPSGKIKSKHALILGLTVSMLGVSQLFFVINELAGILSLTTILLYLFVYTPLKKKTYWNTIIGAIPGALPPLGGWVAATGEIGLGAIILFALLFFWQIPHFIAIAWIYREDYKKAGFKMITTKDNCESSIRWHIGIFTLGMIISSLLPTIIGMLGMLYFVGTCIISLIFIQVSWSMMKNMNDKIAVKLLATSIIYHPIMLCLIIIDLFLIK